jgi:hypothetical protein
MSERIARRGLLKVGSLARMNVVAHWATFTNTFRASFSSSSRIISL